MVSLFASFAAVLLLVFIPEKWWLFLFGQSFSGIRELLLLLLPGLATYGIYLIISYMQSSEGKFEKNLYPLLTAFGVNVGITGWYWSQDIYILEKGIIALSFSWVFAAVGAAFIRIKSAGKSLLK
jgi:O-antigen/teichoic acid export membrane protein